MFIQFTIVLVDLSYSWNASLKYHSFETDKLLGERCLEVQADAFFKCVFHLGVQMLL